MLGVLVEELAENVAGCGLVRLEEVGVLLANAPGSIQPGGEWLVPREVDQNVESVGVRQASAVRHLVEVDSALAERILHVVAADPAAPLGAEFVRIGEQGSHGVGDVIAVLDEPQPLCVRVEVVDRFRRNPDLGLVDVELSTRLDFGLVYADVSRRCAVVERRLGLLDQGVRDRSGPRR